MKLEKNQVEFDKTNDAYDCRRGVEYLPRSLCAGSRGAVARQEKRPPSWHIWWCARNLQIETKWVGPYSIWTVGKRVMRLSCVFLDDANDIQACCKLKANKEQRLGLGWIRFQLSSREHHVAAGVRWSGLFAERGGRGQQQQKQIQQLQCYAASTLACHPHPSFRSSILQWHFSTTFTQSRLSGM